MGKKLKDGHYFYHFKIKPNIAFPHQSTRAPLYRGGELVFLDNHVNYANLSAFHQQAFPCWIGQRIKDKEVPKGQTGLFNLVRQLVDGTKITSLMTMTIMTACGEAVSTTRRWLWDGVGRAQITEKDNDDVRGSDLER